MIERPGETEAAPHFFTYINQVAGDDPLHTLEAQLDDAAALFAGISEEASLHRYAPEKWSIRQVLNHTTDTERALVFRTLWFARGFEAPVPGYDQNIGVAGGEADGVSWASHVAEFRAVRLATIALFRNLPPAGWARSGHSTSGSFFTVRALAYIIPGHVAHHLAILRKMYL
jgi:hypothetical protein